MGSNRIRVPIKGTIGKSVLLPTGGATIGLDLKLPDGSTPTLAQLATALGVTATPVASSTTVSSLYSVTGDGSPSRPLQLNGDTATPGNSKFYGTSASGARGWQSLVVADSVVGNGVGTPLSLSGDVSAPGNNYFYGTNGTGVKGWAAQSALALTSGQVTTALGFTPYNATNPSAYISSVTVADSVVGNGVGTALSLSGDVSAPGNSMLYGTNASGVKGWYAQPSGGGSGANPTALVGLTAVNGTAATFLRSDGAPALDVSIAPTWTGAHIFAATAGIPLTVTSTVAGVGAQLNTGAIIAPPAGLNALYVNGSALTATPGNGAANVMAAPSGGVGSIYQRPDAVAVAGIDLWLQRTTTASALEQGATIRYSDTASGYSGTTQFTKTGTNTCQFEWWEYAGTSWSKVASLDQGGNLSLAGGLGLHGSAPPAKVTGWGTPTGATLVANFAGGSATLAQTSEVVAYILTTLKLMGIYGG